MTFITASLRNLWVRDWLQRPSTSAAGGQTPLLGAQGGEQQDGSFEVLVGKNVSADGQARRFGSVYGYDQKPKRRVYEVPVSISMLARTACAISMRSGSPRRVCHSWRSRACWGILVLIPR